MAIKIVTLKEKFMAIKIGSITYDIGDESFESDEVKIISQKLHEEPGFYKEPNDTVEEVIFEASTEHGIITGKATARRSGFDTDFELENIDVNIDNKEINITTPECNIEEGEDEY